MLLNLTTYSSEPIYSQIANQILDSVIYNEIQAGDEVMSIAKLSRQQHLGKSTVAKAYSKLEKMGIICRVQNERFVINNLSELQRKKYEKEKRLNNISQSEKERIDTELETAKQIQQSMLPLELPDTEDISVAAYSTISNEVGGDFYDFFELEENKYGVLIGDASGKGLSAAMIISQIQAIIKSDISNKRSITQTLSIVNTYLKSFSAAKNFATLFYGELDLSTGILKYANAGHNYPMIIKQHGGIEHLKTTGPALGLISNTQYKDMSTKIENDDLLFLFTDGLSECMNDSSKQYGEERIENILKRNKNKTSKQIIDDIKKDVDLFSSEPTRRDDTTFIMIKLNNSRKVN